MHTLSPFMDELLSEERQLMKWVGIFQVGIFWWEFSGGGIGLGRNSPGGILSGRIFLKLL